MSSSRSLASARSKRAGGNPTVPSESIKTPQQTPSTPQNSGSQMSITQAFGRIGERLNNLELFAETTTTVVNDIQEFHSNTSEKYVVDKEVFTSIVDRIETLERTREEKAGNDVSSSSSITTMLNDIEELKSHLIRLQTYVMETNAKLQDMVFHKNGSSLVNFTDVFSDSHPTPHTLIPKVIEEKVNVNIENGDEIKAVSDNDIEIEEYEMNEGGS